MKPFDLAAAKAGAPIMCRDGTPAKFIAHVPEAKPGYRVVALVGSDTVTVQFEDGRHWADVESNTDLFMAPTKRTVWLNMYLNGIARMHPTQRAADESGENNRIGGKAWPLEIEDYDSLPG
jgi:hypothetical protein